MAEILLFHHAQGRTPGVLAFANDLRQAGYRVHALGTECRRPGVRV